MVLVEIDEETGLLPRDITSDGATRMEAADEDRGILVPVEQIRGDDRNASERTPIQIWVAVDGTREVDAMCHGSAQQAGAVRSRAIQDRGTTDEALKLRVDANRKALAVLDVGPEAAPRRLRRVSVMRVKVPRALLEEHPEASLSVPVDDALLGDPREATPCAEDR